MPPAARVTDMHTCPMVTGVVPHVGGPILPPGHPTTIIGGMPAARVGDMCTCVGPPDTITKGSPTVIIGGMPAARMGDSTAHGGVIVLGHFTTMIGDAGSGGGGGGGGGGGAGADGGGGGGVSSTTTAAMSEAKGVTDSAVVCGVSPSVACECTDTGCQATFEQAAEAGVSLIECGTYGEEKASAENDEPGDLDAEIAAAPVTEEKLGDNAPEFEDALGEKHRGEEEAGRAPKWREEEEK